MNFEEDFSDEEFNNGVGMYSVPPPPIDDDFMEEEEEFFFEDDDDPNPDLILPQYNQRPLVHFYDNDEDNSSSSEQNLIELETLYGYRRAENLPGFIILNSAPGQPGHTSCFIADFDLKNEASQTQEEQKKRMMMETQCSDVVVIEKEELLPPQEVDISPPPPPLPPPAPVTTNAWGTGGIYKTLNIRDPMEIAKMAKEQEDAEAKIAAAAAAAATAAAKAKTYATNTNTNNNNRRFRGGRDTRDTNMNNHHTTAARVSILRPKAEEHKEGSVSSTTTTSSTTTKDNYQQVSRGKGDKQQSAVDENAPRMDLLCKFSENRHSSRDRKKCMRSHSLEAWVPRTCHRSQCTNQACNYFHATKETKKEFLERLVNSETSFYYSFRNDFRRLYL